MAGDEEICLFDSLTEHQLAIVGTFQMSETTIMVSQVSTPKVVVEVVPLYMLVDFQARRYHPALVQLFCTHLGLDEDLITLL